MSRGISFIIPAVAALALLAAPLHRDTALAGPAGKASSTAKTKSGGGKAPAAQSKKVDIDADNMEIFDEKNQAVFTGNVKLVRQDVTMTADKLVVEYRKTPKKDGSESTEVTFLNAYGNVRIVNPKQTVTGDHAKMDVKKNLLWVDGNVTVKKKDTTVIGDKLFSNLDTNVSRVDATGKGRVHSSFIPAK